MKKIVHLMSVIIILAMLVGCQIGSKAPISADEFTTKAETAGYIVQDGVDQFPEGAVDEYLLAIKGTDEIDYQIEFAVVPTVEQAKSAYQENYDKIESKKGLFSTHISVSIGNFSSYKLTTDEKYYVISRIENTFIYVDASAEYKDEIDDFLESIGY